MVYVQVLAKAHGTIGQSPFTRVSAVEVPVAWAGTGLLINPYDVIVADEDGVVVVRPSTIDAVLEQVAKGQEADAKCLEDIKAGGTVADAFRKHRGKK
jgi:regulator of RNase E activity RraA